MEYVVNMAWDSGSRVWIATSDDIPGLVMESDSYDTLIDRVDSAVSELLLLNLNKKGPVTLRFHSERNEQVAL